MSDLNEGVETFGAAALIDATGAADAGVKFPSVAKIGAAATSAAAVKVSAYFLETP